MCASIFGGAQCTAHSFVRAVCVSEVKRAERTYTVTNYVLKRDLFGRNHTTIIFVLIYEINYMTNSQFI